MILRHDVVESAVMVREWGTVVEASKVMLTFSGPCWALPDSIGGQVTMK